MSAPLPPEVQRILYVRNLPFKISNTDLYDLFSKYGQIRQIRVGNTPETRGTGFVVYEDVYEAKAALEALSGFNLMGRYLIVVYFQPGKLNKRQKLQKQEEELAELKRKIAAGEKINIGRSN